MKEQKFEIATLDSANLVELDGFKQSQLKLVEDHPFVIVKDPKSYSEAKVNRTALKTGRTSIQNQDKIIASTIQTFRKGTVAKKDELIAITKPGEDLQQESIDQWELGIQWCKEIEEGKEEERVENIKEYIEDSKIALNDVIEKTTFDIIDQREENFNTLVNSWKEFDAQEFEFLMIEMIDEKREQLSNKIEEVKQTESTRLEQLAKDQQSKIDSLFREATEMIDQSHIGIIDTLKPALEVILDVDFDFGILTDKYISVCKSIHEKANVKIEWLKEQKEKVRLENIQIQKQQVINVREGLLDLVHQMTVENFEKETIKIKESVDQDFETTVPNAMEEVTKLKDRVNDALKRKLEEIDNELKKTREDEEAEGKRMEGVMKDRVKKIVKLGMVEQESETEWIGFGFRITDERLYEEDDIQTIIDEIKEYKAIDKKEKARQKRIAPERELLVDFIENGIRRTTLSAKLKQPEMIEFKNHIESELNGFCDSLIETLKSK